jgi:hypothetical protein
MDRPTSAASVSTSAVVTNQSPAPLLTPRGQPSPRLRSCGRPAALGGSVVLGPAPPPAAARHPQSVAAPQHKVVQDPTESLLLSSSSTLLHWVWHRARSRIIICLRRIVCLEGLVQVHIHCWAALHLLRLERESVGVWARAGHDGERPTHSRSSLPVSAAPSSFLVRCSTWSVPEHRVNPASVQLRLALRAEAKWSLTVSSRLLILPAWSAGDSPSGLLATRQHC